MPDIAVTPDQRERLRWIQRRLEEDIAYGHVRPCDALDYLLDHAEATDGLADIDADSTTPSKSATESASVGSEASAEELAGADSDVHDSAAGANTEAADDGTESPDASTKTDDEGDAANDDSGSNPANGDTTLNSMMSLLSTHDDKWREASVGDEKYEVDLPDGSTEPARTKDDVRALLFKHHR